VTGYEQLSREELLGLLAERERRVEELSAQVAGLEERLARLERLASRNSGNSSFPPSMDDLPGRTAPREKPRRGTGTKRGPGKQPGAPGSHLAWSEAPDDTVPHFPAGLCACGADLATAADLGVAASHQIVDIPLETATVTQHDLHEVACTCGRVHRAAAPGGQVLRGRSLTAWRCRRGVCT
jgi:transposase